MTDPQEKPTEWMVFYRHPTMDTGRETPREWLLWFPFTEENIKALRDGNIFGVATNQFEAHYVGIETSDPAEAFYEAYPQMRPSNGEGKDGETERHAGEDATHRI